VFCMRERLAWVPYYNTLIQSYMFILLQMFPEMDFCLRMIRYMTLTSWDLVHRFRKSKVHDSNLSRVQANFKDHESKIAEISKFLCRDLNLRPSSPQDSMLPTPSCWLTSNLKSFTTSPTGWNSRQLNIIFPHCQTFHNGNSPICYFSGLFKIIFYDDRKSHRIWTI
jgi:hypothetical protein